MGLIDKIKNNYDYRKVDKFTKRRLSQSGFESQDRQYYERVYRSGEYINPKDSKSVPTSKDYLNYKQNRWSIIPDVFKKSNKKQFTSPNQLKTSEAYVMGYTRQ